MTAHKPELMPDEVFVCFGGTVQDIPVYVTVIDKGETRRPEIYSSYTRTDLYTSACAERDALRELCEGMAGALSVFLEECQFGGMPPTGKSITAAEDAIIEYRKHKAGE